jgi:hypothetical protein
VSKPSTTRGRLAFEVLEGEAVPEFIIGHQVAANQEEKNGDSLQQIRVGIVPRKKLETNWVGGNM